MEKFSYDNAIVKKFGFATLIFALVGMTVGLWIALELAFPSLNLNRWMNFGRLRPLHTNAIIFAFVGNAMFTGIYYSMQRLLKTRMFSDKLSNIHFWGWQGIILAAAISLPLGYTTSKEYAELEWPIDIAITLIWVVFGWNMFGTILKRRVRHLYVAIWFYIATFVTVAVLHIFNSFEIPVTFMKSYSWYAGVQDALVQWWYGHNAVAFFLTTPFLGLMYYFVPKAANRPVYSYRLSIIHFWTLIFLYIWAGPHHLLYTALPDWAQSLGVAFSIMLLMPSWGGMLNGLLTLRGAWDKVREDPVLKFMVVAITAYGMSTFEGPMLSLKNVNFIAHYTDWIVAHVHIGGLGWNGMMTFGMLYFIFPRIFGTKLFSVKLANAHFWIATLGILFWAIPMYWAGFLQGSMWQEFKPEGVLKYGNFTDTVEAIKPMFMLRSFGGLLYLIGAIVGIYNLFKTVSSGKLIANEEAEAPALVKTNAKEKGEGWHRVIERKPIRMLILSLIVILIGGAIEIIPTIVVKSNIPTIKSVKPITPLELTGRDLYIREGCNNCHSQMIRPLRFETERYGEYSKAGEFVYDHPHLWGSKRTGPDLHREGGKRSDAWHYNHFIDPIKTDAKSVMPSYDFLTESELDLSDLPKKINAMRTLGVPYAKDFENVSIAKAEEQARIIAESIIDELSDSEIENKEAKINELSKKEVVALIAYLQRLGTDINAKEEE